MRKKSTSYRLWKAKTLDKIVLSETWRIPNVLFSLCLLVLSERSVVIDCTWNCGSFQEWTNCARKLGNLHRRADFWNKLCEIKGPWFDIISLGSFLSPTGSPNDAMPPHIYSPDDHVVYEKEPGNYRCGSVYQLDSLNYSDYVT